MSENAVRQKDGILKNVAQGQLKKVSVEKEVTLTGIY